MKEVSLGDIINADATPGKLALPTLARATLLFGSKDSRKERDDPRATCRTAGEDLKALLIRRDGAGLSDFRYGMSAVRALQDLLLPPPYHAYACSGDMLLEEIKAAYSYFNGSTSEVLAVERARVLRAHSVHDNLKPLLPRGDEHA